MTKYINYDVMPDYMREYRDYTHGSSHAESSYDANMGGQVYRIWSYRTLIAVITEANNQVVYLDNQYYSMTTSKLQAMIRRVYGVNTKDRVVFETTTK